MIRKRDNKGRFADGPWHEDETVKAVLYRIDAGDTYQVAAQHLGLTRNQVAGIVQRYTQSSIRPIKKAPA